MASGTGRTGQHGAAKAIASPQDMAAVARSPVIGGLKTLPDGEVAIGRRLTLHSAVLAEDREILVHLPDDYGESRLRYPVLVLLDGDLHFMHGAGAADLLARAGYTPDMIVVAVPTMFRRMRDLTPPVTHDAKAMEMFRHLPAGMQVGGDDAFLAFLADELLPWVDAHYRTEPFRILMGHSLGGLFALDALVKRPDAFQGDVVVSPSLWWDGGALVGTLEEKLPTLSGHHAVYLSWGEGEADIRRNAQAFSDWSAAHPAAGLLLRSHAYAGENHDAGPLPALFDGLQWIYRDWPYEVSPRKDQDYAALVHGLDVHAADLSRRYGYAVAPTGEQLHRLAQYLRRNQRYDEALQVNARALEQHPQAMELLMQRANLEADLGHLDAAMSAQRAALQHPNEYAEIAAARADLAALEQRSADARKTAPAH